MALPAAAAAAAAASFSARLFEWTVTVWKFPLVVLPAKQVSKKIMANNCNIVLRYQFVLQSTIAML